MYSPLTRLNWPKNPFGISSRFPILWRELYPTMPAWIETSFWRIRSGWYGLEPLLWHVYFAASSVLTHDRIKTTQSTRSPRLETLERPIRGCWRRQDSRAPHFSSFSVVQIAFEMTRKKSETEADELSEVGQAAAQPS